MIQFFCCALDSLFPSSDHDDNRIIGHRNGGCYYERASKYKERIGVCPERYRTHEAGDEKFVGFNS
jgi:hypothetical protein